MRIVAGDFRGRALEAPAGDGTRPTIDRVREALFSSLYSMRGDFEGAIVLDAFAGSGALGLEALSRGAQRAVFFERDPKAASTIKGNIAACKLDAARAAVVRRDVMQAPPTAQTPPFDLVFLDPPYDFAAPAVLGFVAELKLAGAIAPDALVVYEHALKAAGEVEAAAQAVGLSTLAMKKYGKTGVAFFGC